MAWRAADGDPSRTPPGGRDIDQLGFLGVSGMTAYFGMFDVGRIKPGETICISGAAGSVGLIATQIALAHKSCKVIAIVGSQEKVDLLNKLGATALNYRLSGFAGRLRAAGGIDVYFDNVGGELLDVVLAQINPYARIVLCGAISQYVSEHQQEPRLSRARASSLRPHPTALTLARNRRTPPSPTVSASPRSSSP